MMSNELYTIILAALPISELRGSIPLAVEVLHLSPLSALFWSLVGNSLPAFVVIFGLRALDAWSAKNFLSAHRLLERVYARTERMFKEKHDKYGALGLFIFTAIPLPMTGVWSASVAAVLFKIKPKYALPAILLGMLAAGLIVTIATVGIGALI